MKAIISFLKDLLKRKEGEGVSKTKLSLWAGAVLYLLLSLGVIDVMTFKMLLVVAGAILGVGIRDLRK